MHTQIEGALALDQIDLRLGILRQGRHVAQVDELLDRIGCFERILTQILRVQACIRTGRFP